MVDVRAETWAVGRAAPREFEWAGLWVAVWAAGTVVPMELEWAGPMELEWAGPWAAVWAAPWANSTQWPPRVSRPALRTKGSPCRPLPSMCAQDS